MTTFPEVVDSTMLATLKACPQKFAYEYLGHWRPKQPSVHLHAGAAFAKGLEVTRRSFYEIGARADDAVAIGLKALLEAYGHFECPSHIAKTAERMAGAFEFYWSNYPLDHDTAPITLPGGKMGIEFSFAHPLPILHPETNNPLIYAGRMDCILSYAGGTYIVDEKTTSSLGPSWSKQWDLRAQFTGYAWGCREAGVRVDGAIVRGVSILKEKYDTQQAITYRPEWQIDRWFNELQYWLNHAIELWRVGFWPHSLDSECTAYGGCPFREVCASQDEAPWLEARFSKRKWNPLTRTEEGLGADVVNPCKLCGQPNLTPHKTCDTCRAQGKLL